MRRLPLTQLAWLMALGGGETSDRAHSEETGSWKGFLPEGSIQQALESRFSSFRSRISATGERSSNSTP